MSQTYAPEVEKVALKLRKEYEDFAHHNKKNPLDELFFILCSVKRSEKVYLKAYKSIKRNFPRYELLATSSTKKISKTVSWGGLQNQKAAIAKEIIRQLIVSFGKPTLAPLKKMSDEECESYLMSLPGIGKKVARCVMLYSLNRRVFPVDAHCWRISRRIGWNVTGRNTDSCSNRAMDHLQARIPPALRFSLHVNMVSHGRKICTASKPKCGECVIVFFCKKIGVAKG
ncbi:MAG: endonuclease III domain-containing protein [Dissulfurispiraceae bacterium]